MNKIHEEMQRMIELCGRALLAVLVAALFIEANASLAAVLFILLFIWSINPVLPTILADLTQVKK